MAILNVFLGNCINYVDWFFIAKIYYRQFLGLFWQWFKIISLNTNCLLPLYFTKCFIGAAKQLKVINNFKTQ